MSYKKTPFKSALGYEGKVLINYQLQIQYQQQLLNIIKSALPDNLSNHALHCVPSANKISLYTDSAVWSSQLRFYQQAILQALNSLKSGERYTALQIKIIPKIKARETHRALSLPSSENINAIINEAENRDNDELKTALLRLGKTLKKLAIHEQKTDGSI